MPRYKVSVITDGRFRHLILTAKTREAARLEFARRGKVIAVKRSFCLDLFGGIGQHARHLFLIRLAGMLESQHPLTQALQSLGAAFPGRIRSVAERVADHVEAGDDLPAALGRFPKDFPPSLVALIKASVQGYGSTAKALRDAADFEAEIRDHSQKLGEGIWISTANTTLASFSILATIHVFQPMLLSTALMRDFKDRLQMDLVNMASWVSSSFVLLYLAIIILLLGLSTIGRSVTGTLADRLIAYIPLVRDLVLARERHLMLFELSLLIKAGVAIDFALRMVAETVQQGAMRFDLLAASDAVRVGDNWAEKLKSLSSLDRISLSSAEDRRETARIFEVLAQTQFDLYIYSVGVIRPLMLAFSVIGLGISGAILFGLLIIPVLQVMEQMAKG